MAEASKQPTLLTTIAVADQIWDQNTPGIDDIAEAQESFGKALHESELPVGDTV